MFGFQKIMLIFAAKLKKVVCQESRKKGVTFLRPINIKLFFDELK